MMTWEDTIKYIRTQPEYQQLVLQAYFHEDLVLNIKNYASSAEFSEILKIIRQYAPNARRILDIGSGNGIATIAFALNGFLVDAVEPDPSATVGANAILQAAEVFGVTDKIKVHVAYAEDLSIAADSFDIVFARQSLHHAYNLQSFVQKMAESLKKGGLFLSVRDHVIYNQTDKEAFLATHPLQHFYGGENAFDAATYRQAISLAGLTLIQEIRFFDSVINYYPIERYRFIEKDLEEKIKSDLHKKIGVFSKSNLIVYLYKHWHKIRLLKEADIPGRMYSYIAVK